jgi:ribose transport system permease protein
MTAFWARSRLIVLAYVAMIVLLLVTSLFSPGFLAESNIRSVVVLAAFVGIVALGQTFVIIGGGIDLSLPWVLNSAAILMTLLADSQDGPLIWIVPLMLAGGAAIGLINGIGVAAFGVPPIIMTLATNVILQGLILVYTGGTPPPSAPPLIQFLAVGRFGPIPVIALIWAGLAVVAWVLLSRAAFGRYLYALGTSRTVAEYSGVPTLRTMVLTGYSGQAYLGMGDPYLFTSIAAVAIGGASILGGSGHYIGTIAGALVLTILGGLLPALRLSSGALLVVYGVVILLTVAVGSETFGALGSMLFRRRRD